MNKKFMFAVIVMIFLGSIMSAAYAADEEQSQDSGFLSKIKDWALEKIMGDSVENATQTFKQKALSFICSKIWWVILALGITFGLGKVTVGNLRSLGITGLIDTAEKSIIGGLAISIGLWWFFGACWPRLLLWILAILSALDLTLGLKKILTGLGGSIKPGDGKAILSRAGMLARFGKGAKTDEEKKQLIELERELNPRRIRTILVIYEEMIMEDYVAKGMGYRVEDAQRTVIDTIADAKAIEKKLAEEKFHMWKRLKGLE